MDTSLYIKSLIVGVLIALPFGPVGALSVRRALSHGRMAGMVSGIGSSLADIVYVIIIQLGLTQISATMIKYRPFLRVASLVLIIFLGVRFLRSNVLVREGDREPFGYNGLFTSAFCLSVINPTILLSLAILFAGAGLGRQSPDRFAPELVVIAVFIGSVACWAMLTGIIERFRRMMSPSHLNIACKIAGGAVILLGAGALLRH